MTLFEKITTIYPNLDDRDLALYIRLQNDSDGQGDYIKEWNHPTLAQPTQEDLDAIEETE
jgi:hypothetical protein